MWYVDVGKNSSSELLIGLLFTHTEVEYQGIHILEYSAMLVLMNWQRGVMKESCPLWERDAVVVGGHWFEQGLC